MITGKIFRIVAALAISGAVVACEDTTGVNPADFNSLSESNARPITVLSRNLYMGTEIDQLMTAPPEQVPMLVTQVWQQIQKTNFPERARAIAAEVAANDPDLIGLQEADVFRIQVPSDFMQGNFRPNATDVALDFTQTLLDALAARGLSYHVVVKQQGLDVEFPMVVKADPLTFGDLRYTEFDVILARNNIATGKTYAVNYQVNAPIVINGLPLDWKRGWVGTEAVIGKDTIVFASTHQEIQMFRPVGEMQTDELIASLNTMTHPVVLVGDFNSAANASAPADRKTGAYNKFINAGFEDMWLAAHPASQEGLTCCHAVDLSDAFSSFDQRLDLVLVKQPNGSMAGSAQTWLVGLNPTERTPSGLWASDHAGIVATLHLPRK